MYLLCEWASRIEIDLYVGLPRDYITWDLKLVWSEWVSVIFPAEI